ncbi:MAG: SipW-dependent-type signal peptide-containing protein [Clostridia bacterium]|nr:SipW-dependent-type signal peptide-containing protein [Clostridia bacterium]
MVKMKSTKSALATSVCALVLCISMLAGSTFAWFTDSVTSNGNKIQAGSLNVDLELLGQDGKWNSIKESRAPLYNYNKWEPGYMDVKILKIENEGTLSLKWYAKFVSDSEISSLADVIDVYVCSSKTEALTYPVDRNLAGYTKVGTLRQFINTIETTTQGKLEAERAAYLGIALKMQETAGNEYQGLAIGPFDIQVLATQDTFEADSFDDQYDQNATYPLVATETKLTDVPMVLSAGKFDVMVPASAPAGTYAVSITNVVDSVSEDQTSLVFSLNIETTMLVTAEETLFAVSVEVGQFKNVLSVKNLGASNAAVSNVTYNNQAVTFQTSGSGVFEVVYASVGENIRVSEDGHLIGGDFKGVNPATFDPTLAAADSAYIAINYTKNGEKHYVIAERATTTLVAADDADYYVAENGNYEVTKNQSGKLWSLISGLQNQEFSTVYILPGVYNEATTIGVYSSMDIVGLGDKENIEIVRQSGSAQHLFNCSGTKEDYIQVTIRNLYLNVKVGATTKNKDVGAVQSIRRSMVKCYDLIVYKNEGYGFNNAAFYVNANNDAAGTYCDAYLYVENTVIYGKAQVVSTSYRSATPRTQYHFNYSNLTYNDGTKTYTQNGGYILNKTMAPNVWEW